MAAAKTQARVREIRAIIEKNKTLGGYSDAKLAERLRISRTTLYSRYNHPETWSLGELTRLSTILNFSQDDKNVLF